MIVKSIASATVALHSAGARGMHDSQSEQKISANEKILTAAGLTMKHYYCTQLEKTEQIYREK